MLSSSLKTHFENHDTHTLTELSLLEETLPKRFGKHWHPAIKPLAYGETPLEVAEELLAWTEPKREENFLDLGCGCGALVLVAAPYFCRSVGVDLVPAAVQFARESAHKFSLECEFFHQDFLDFDYQSFHVLCCSATAVSPWLAEQLEERLWNCQAGTRIITVENRLRSPRVARRQSLVREFSWSRWQRPQEWTFYLHQLG